MRRAPALARWLAVWLCLLAHPAVRAAEPAPLLGFAAASMIDALEEIGEAFTARTGIPVRWSFGSSGALARQIAAGAPAAVYISASQNWLDWLERARPDQVVERTQLAGNQLVLAVPTRSTLALEFSPALPALLCDGRLAIADEGHAPAGMYAESVLRALGVWDVMSTRLVRTADARRALALVARGEVAGAIVYRSDANSLAAVRIADLAEPGMHPPVRYGAALLSGSDDGAAGRLFAFLKSGISRDILERHGFTVLDEPNQ